MSPKKFFKLFASTLIDKSFHKFSLLLSDNSHRSSNLIEVHYPYDGFVALVSIFTYVRMNCITQDPVRIALNLVSTEAEPTADPGLYCLSPSPSFTILL